MILILYVAGILKMSAACKCLNCFIQEQSVILDEDLLSAALELFSQKPAD